MSVKKVENHPDLIRDDFSKAVINSNDQAYQAYLLQRDRLKSDKERIRNLEGEVQELKALVMQMLNK